MQAGEQTELEIERIVPGGAGLAHASGTTFFVPLTAPGDRILARIERTQKRIAFASLARVIKPSAERVAPPCKFFGRCGGCDFQHLNYTAQLEAKKEIVRDCLRRIARIENLPEIEIAPAPHEWNYRSRARWQFDARRKILGYYELASHRILDVDACPVLVADAQRTLSDLREAMRRGELPPNVNEIQVSVGQDRIGLAMRSDDDFTADEDLQLRIGDEIYHYNAACFFQTNHELLAPLIEEALQDARGENALDLYCGVGLFTLPLARRFRQVTGVEGSTLAANFARRNLAAAGLTNATIKNARVGEWLNENSLESRVRSLESKRSSRFKVQDSKPEVQRSKTKLQVGNRQSAIGNLSDSRLQTPDSRLSFGFALLDPPRSGAEKETIKSLLALRPACIVYVSCDPATLARDLRALLETYRLERVKAFDLFPQTHHVETVAHLAVSYRS